MNLSVQDTLSAASNVPDERDLLLSMTVIRQFELEVQRLFGQGLIRATTHLGNGQEAVSVGACAALRAGDTMTCTYRGHAAALAMGASLNAAFGELLGRARGLCGGKGGSMHLADFALGVMGSNAIVGAHLPIATGLAFAEQYRGSGGVSLCFFGDGATNIGAFHEAMNLAGIWKLPLLFVCENNLYGEYSPVSSTTPVSRLADRAAAYAMPGIQVDGNDVLAVYAVVETAVRRARAGEGPTFIEALTYRVVGHSRSDPGAYRPAGELDAWQQRDPLKRSATRLRASGLSESAVLQIETEAKRQVLEASAVARSWDPPKLGSVTTDVYA